MCWVAVVFGLIPDEVQVIVMEEHNKMKPNVLNGHSHLMHGEGGEGSMCKCADTVRIHM